MKRQIKRLSAHFPGVHVSLNREFDVFGFNPGKVEVQFCSYAGTDPCLMASGKSARSAVDALLEKHAEARRRAASAAGDAPAVQPAL